MFDELTKYKNSDHFFFQATDALSQVCNAPTNQSGIYIVYALKGGKIELVYIGRSGKLESDGTLFIRKTGLGGIKDRIVNGHQFGKIARRKSWPIQMLSEGIEALDVYWYATHGINLNDCPRALENKLLKQYAEMFEQLPRWNRAF